MLRDLADWLLDLSTPANSFSRLTSNTSEGAFELWFRANGGYINPDVEITFNQSEGNSLQVRGDRDLPSGTTIISCPHHLTLSWPSAHRYHLTHIHSAFRPHIATRLFLMKQYLLQECSPWWPYIKNLPQPYQKDSLNTPLYYNSDDLLWIAGTDLEHARRVRLDIWRKEYDDAVRELFEDQADRHQSELWTWSVILMLMVKKFAIMLTSTRELYLWTATIMSSRSFGGPIVFSQDESDFPIPTDVDAKSPMLIPGLDLLNHDPSQSVTWLWESSLCTIKNNVKVTGGSQIWNNYGPKSNAELIMGYGFSLPDNSADHLSITFSSDVFSYIRATKSRRLTIGSSPDSTIGSSQEVEIEHTKSQNRLFVVGEAPVEETIHWVRLLNNGCQFSPSFLEDFSIAVENHRERAKADNNPLPNGSFLDTSLSRNKLHVICAVVMKLQKAQSTMCKHGKDLRGEPQNARQLDAARYRQGQLRILENVLGYLHTILRSYMDTNKPDKARSLRVIRLEHTMTNSPKRLLKDFRTVLNAGLRTRDPSKIRERGGSDFAFTVWLCGLWIYAQTDNTIGRGEIASDAGVEPRFLYWLHFLNEIYSEGKTQAQSSGLPMAFGHGVAENEWFDSARNKHTEEDLYLVAVSYLDAVNAAVAKHPHSLYNDPKITVQGLAWCLNVVRSEGFWYPHLQENEQEEDDEWVLFLERGPT